MFIIFHQVFSDVHPSSIHVAGQIWAVTFAGADFAGRRCKKPPLKGPFADLGRQHGPEFGRLLSVLPC